MPASARDLEGALDLARIYAGVGQNVSVYVYVCVVVWGWFHSQFIL